MLAVAAGRLHALRRRGLLACEDRGDQPLAQLAGEREFRDPHAPALRRRERTTTRTRQAIAIPTQSISTSSARGLTALDPDP